MPGNGERARRIFGRPVTDGPPVEHLRCGASPVDDMYERPVTPEMVDEAIRDWAADEKSWGGRWEDGSPRVRGLGGGLIGYPQTASFLPRKRVNGRMVLAFPECECGEQFVSQEFLDAHREREHGPAGDDAA